MDKQSEPEILSAEEICVLVGEPCNETGEQSRCTELGRCECYGDIEKGAKAQRAKDIAFYEALLKASEDGKC